MPESLLVTSVAKPETSFPDSNYLKDEQLMRVQHKRKAPEDKLSDSSDIYAFAKN
jgi:hypothetical protein